MTDEIENKNPATPETPAGAPPRRPPTAGLRDAITQALQPRNGSRAHLVPYVAGTVLLLIVVAGLSLRAIPSHHAMAPAAASTAARAAPPPRVVSGTPAPISPIAPAAAPTQATAPAQAGAPAPAAQPTGPTVQPPAGLGAGKIRLARFVFDPFGRPQQVSVSTVDSAAVAVTADKGTSQKAREVWTAWVSLPAPATMAQVGIVGGQGTITVAIDSSELGQPAERGMLSKPSLMNYPVNLGTGWHEITITDDVPDNPYGTPPQVSVDLGDGVNAPAAVTPYAVPVGGAAPASASAPASAASAASAAAKPAAKAGKAAGKVVKPVTADATPAASAPASKGGH